MIMEPSSAAVSSSSSASESVSFKGPFLRLLEGFLRLCLFGFIDLFWGCVMVSECSALGLEFRFVGLPRPPNYPLIYPKYPLLRTIRALLKVSWGFLAVLRARASPTIPQGLLHFHIFGSTYQPSNLFQGSCYLYRL